MQPPRASPRINAIDGYRAIAILGVLLDHVSRTPGFPNAFRAIFQFAPLGLRAFWVLSGFLITRSLLRDEERDHRIVIGKFYARQAIRYFVPLLGYVLPLTLWIALRYPGGDWVKWLRPLLLDPNTYCIAQGVAHLYSLVLQIYFWLAWPLLLKIAPPRARLPIGIILGGAAAVWMDYGQSLAIERGGCSGRVDYFAAPIIIGGCFALAQPYLRRFARTGFAIVIGLALVTMSILLVLADVPVPILEAILSVGLGLIVSLLVDNRAPRINRILSWSGLTWLGRISFSVYLWQNLFCLGLSQTPLDRFPQNIFAAIAFGWIAYCIFELPSLRWRSKIKPQSALSPAVVTVPGAA